MNRYPQHEALGTRAYTLSSPTATHYSPSSASDKSPQRGAYVWETFTEFDTAAREVGSGLIALGVAAYDNVGIFSENRSEWLHTSFGCYSQSIRVVALYATLGEDAVEYIVNQ